jgi:hypothetical protein
MEDDEMQLIFQKTMLLIAATLLTDPDAMTTRKFYAKHTSIRTYVRT